MTEKVKYLSLPYDNAGSFEFKIVGEEKTVYKAVESVLSSKITLVCWVTQQGTIHASDFTSKEVLEYLNKEKWTIV